MIITNVCLLLEALSFVICLHCLYGEKFRLDIATVCFLSINMIVMTIINYFELSKVYTMLIYPCIFIYCGIRFGFAFRKMMINNILCVVLVGAIQMLVALPICYAFEVHLVSDMNLLFANCLALAVMAFLLPHCKVNKLSEFLENKGRIVATILCICLVIVLFWMLSYKQFRLLEINQAILLLISIVLIFILTGQLSKYRIRAKEIETELRMQKIYSESFQSLIDDIRLRQHEFDNHINTIYGQLYTCKSLDELVNTQKGYCQVLTRENQFNKLLTNDNPIIIGFLYGKFVEIEKLGIEVTYKANIRNLEINVPTFKVVEILGNLINNAVEAITSMKEAGRLYVGIEEKDYFLLEVRNACDYINYDEICAFFTKGYSKKGENRGLGLYNVKRICDEYKLDILCENVEVEGINWLSIKVRKNQELL